LIKSAEIIIIGGGIIGSSLAYHLSKLGIRDICLLEKGELASGSTGDSAAIIRHHYTNEISIRLVKDSINILSELQHETGNHFLHQNGWVFLCPENADSMFDLNMKQLIDLGIETKEIDIKNTISLLPNINPTGISKVAYEPDSGYADPKSVVESFAKIAKTNGTNIYTNTKVIGISKSNNQINSVETDKGNIKTNKVINAAGPWAYDISMLAGINLPLTVSREQEIMLTNPEQESGLNLSVSNMVDKIYLRPKGKHSVLIGQGHPKTNEIVHPDKFNRKADNQFISETQSRVINRFPNLSNFQLSSSWSGLYTITPDWHMIIDNDLSLNGYGIAVGGSGHSFKLGPSIGKQLAQEIVSSQSSSINISSLGLSRFKSNKEFKSTYGGNRG
tara:strand:+ start:10870 stop:12039 length:1170 start_codon:yes stop_codon:yes gene_type:complete